MGDSMPCIDNNISTYNIYSGLNYPMCNTKSVQLAYCTTRVLSNHLVLFDIWQSSTFFLSSTSNINQIFVVLRACRRDLYINPVILKRRPCKQNCKLFLLTGRIAWQSSELALSRQATITHCKHLQTRTKVQKKAFSSGGPFSHVM